MIAAGGLAGGATRARPVLSAGAAPSDGRPLPAWALLVLGLTAIALAAGLLALGVWQVHRLHWKLALIERVETRIGAPPAPAPGPERWPAISAESDEYRHVRLTGHYLYDRETRVFASTALGSGSWILTPLETAGGFTVLVNRGFIPSGAREAAADRPAHAGGPAAVTGLLRMSEVGGAFLRANDPDGERWYSRDVAAIAERRGLSHAAPYFVDAGRGADPQTLPVGGLTVVRFANSHLVYALTWFALSVLPLAGVAMVGRREWRLRTGHAARAGSRADGMR
ncbi:SURF1 family protein [Chelatococcus reniformis]|uniref:SURF1-like protein n=1 Tax=Chelatococcus reniformis TaxID=1494448 RepID=A0A916TYF3_9HYPH|nr:SURF1 family protein [Chelatococcus reniformis]GGC48811.1 SURF1-like protein [Chelatococcus reniformis]